MKKLFFIAALTLFAVPGIHAQTKTNAQDKNVPQAVMTAFERQYPNTSDVNWKVKDGSYKARFTIDNTKHLAEFNTSGTMTKTGVAIPRQDLPSVVNDDIAKRYANTNTGDIYRIKEDGRTQFMIEIGGRTDRIVIYDEEGNMLKEKP